MTIGELGQSPYPEFFGRDVPEDVNAVVEAPGSEPISEKSIFLPPFDSQHIAAARDQVAAALSELLPPLPLTVEPVSTTISPLSLVPPREQIKEKEAKPFSRVRMAALEDIDRIVALDLKLFNAAYGEERPAAEEVREMMTRRWHNIQNGGGWMHIHEVNGELKGFITAFRTDKSADAFESWENSTNNGTLNNSVNPDGEYAYVANLTVGAGGSKELLMAAAFSGAIKEGIKYGYFSARMPQFRHWVIRQAKAQGKTLEDISREQIDTWASAYVQLRKQDSDQKEVPYDVQLRMYSGVGLEMGKLCPNGFQDKASLNYGVIFKAPVPFARAPKPIRRIVSWGLQAAMRFPKLIEKIL